METKHQNNTKSNYVLFEILLLVHLYTFNGSFKYTNFHPTILPNFNQAIYKINIQIHNKNFENPNSLMLEAITKRES